MGANSLLLEIQQIWKPLDLANMSHFHVTHLTTKSLSFIQFKLQ